LKNTPFEIHPKLFIHYSSFIHLKKNPKLWARHESIDLSFFLDWIDHFWIFHLFIHNFVDFSSSSWLKAHVVAFLHS
jgi:hypothetical protein